MTIYVFKANLCSDCNCAVDSFQKTQKMMWNEYALVADIRQKLVSGRVDFFVSKQL